MNLGRVWGGVYVSNSVEHRKSRCQPIKIVHWVIIYSCMYMLIIGIFDDVFSDWSYGIAIYDSLPPRMAQQPPLSQGPTHYQGFTITLRHTTLGRTTLDEWSARRRYLYLITHKAHNRQTAMPLAGFNPAVSSKRIWKDVKSSFQIRG
jgi:hypothetical protein